MVLFGFPVLTMRKSTPTCMCCFRLQIGPGKHQPVTGMSPFCIERSWEDMHPWHEAVSTGAVFPTDIRRNSWTLVEFISVPTTHKERSQILLAFCLMIKAFNFQGFLSAAFLFPYPTVENGLINFKVPQAVRNKGKRINEEGAVIRILHFIHVEQCRCSFLSAAFVFSTNGGKWTRQL